MSDKDQDDANPFDGETIPGTPPKGATKESKETKEAKSTKAKDPEAKDPEAKAEKKAGAPRKVDYNERVWVMFHESDDMPAHGIPVSVNGTAYLIQPGKVVKVPRFVLRVIDNATMERPIQDATGGKIRGYRRVQRFTYTLVDGPDE